MQQQKGREEIQVCYQVKGREQGTSGLKLNMNRKITMKQLQRSVILSLLLVLYANTEHE